MLKTINGSLVTFLLVWLGFFPASAESENPLGLCAASMMIDGTSQEHQATCEALEFVAERLAPFGITYDHTRPLRKVTFLKEYAYDPENEQYDLSYYDDLKNEVFLLDFETYKSAHGESFQIDFKSWQGFVVGEMMRHFYSVHGNNEALSFFIRSASHYMQVEFIGLEKMKNDYRIPENAEICGYEISDSLYAFDPIFFSLASWYWISQSPKEKLDDIISGKVNLDYIYGRVQSTCK